MKKYFLSIILSVLGVQIFAQTFVTAPLNQLNTSGPHYNHTGIILSPGFTSGSNFHAYITASPLVNCTSLNLSLSQNQNYILTYTPRAPFKNGTELPNQTVCDVNADVQYFDALGRPLQNVLVKGNADGTKDLVSPFVYDELGRSSIAYLPFTSATNNGSFKFDALSVNGNYNQSAQYQFYQVQNAGYLNNAFPYSKTVFEPSPLNRVSEQGAPGEAWQPAASRTSTQTGHTAVQSYLVNEFNEVKLWTLTSNGALSSGYYIPSVGYLYKSQAKDENWVSGKAGITETFKDKLGRLVLKRVWETEVKSLSTYYIYDLSGNLKYVLPPSVNENGLNLNSFTEADASFYHHIYAYKYDEENRVKEKKIPGKNAEWFVYNELDQVILSQNALQKVNNHWSFNKYDWKGRLVISGICTIAGEVDLVQGLANSSTVYWETKDYTNTTTGYRNTTETYPSENLINYYLAINYYDDYEWPGYTSVSSINYSNNTKNLLTGGKLFEINGQNPKFSALFYDDKGRVSKSITQNHIGGRDEIINSYNDFNGELLSSIRTHTSSSQNITIGNDYSYDHLGRIRQTENYINSVANKIILSKIDYNEIGEIKSKSIHSNNGVSFLNQSNYQYNERGWLKSVTNSYAPFNFSLNYQNSSNGVLPQFNGNISNQFWGPSSNTQLHYYNYGYDNLQRLTSGISDESKNEEISYDLMGNILSLKRDNSNNPMLYNYTNGSQLNNISGSYSSSYIYDLNGNQVFDSNKSISLEYNYLNLPKKLTGNGDELNYNWLANGIKIRKTSSGGIRDYIGGVEYNNGVLDFIQTSEGRAYPSSGGYLYEYMIKDHLGNTRVLLHQNGTVSETTDYYPYGKQIARSTVSSPQNNYKYNGKELQQELGLNQYDYGARFYDPNIGRWNVIDPLSESMKSFSQYNYAFNNPIKFIDPDGRFPNSFGNPPDWVRGANGKPYWNSKVTENNLSGLKEGEQYIGKSASNLPTENGYAINLFNVDELPKGESKWEYVLPGNGDMNAANRIEGINATLPAAIAANSNTLKTAEFIAETGTMFALGFVGAAEAGAVSGAGYLANRANLASKLSRFSTRGGGKELKLLTKVAQKAEAAIGGTGNVAGTLKHTYAKNLLIRYQSRFGGNLSLGSNYFNNGIGNRGFLDVVNHSTKTIYDFKFGNAVMNNTQYLKYSRNFEGYGIKIITP